MHLYAAAAVLGLLGSRKRDRLHVRYNRGSRKSFNVCPPLLPHNRVWNKYRFNTTVLCSGFDYAMKMSAKRASEKKGEARNSVSWLWTDQFHTPTVAVNC
jgi:hypothetical protein